MDVYSLTRKKRPSHLTVAQPSSRVASDNDSALEIRKTQRFEEVTDSPTRAHWKPDSDATMCGFLGCQINFGLFERRHHCRKCGDIFCSLHCSNYFRVDQDAEFHPKGILSRGCDNCAEKYKIWQNELKSAATREQHQQSSSRKRHTGIMTQQPQIMEGVTELGRDDIVQSSKQQPRGISINNKSNKKDQSFNPIPSVPADWHWSTF